MHIAASLVTNRTAHTPMHYTILSLGHAPRVNKNILRRGLHHVMYNWKRGLKSTPNYTNTERVATVEFSITRHSHVQCHFYFFEKHRMYIYYTQYKLSYHYQLLKWIFEFWNSRPLKFFLVCIIFGVFKRFMQWQSLHACRNVKHMSDSVQPRGPVCVCVCMNM